MWQTFGEFVRRTDPALGPGVRERVAFAATVTGERVAESRAEAAEAARQVRAIARPGMVIALPTVPCIAPRVDAGDEEIEFFRGRSLQLTCIAGLSGLPQVTVPAGPVDGCPVGASLIGWPGGDEALLELAVALAG